MSKTISFRGQLPIGTEDRIKLSTIKGKTGYKINKFQIMSNSPGATGSVELVCQIFNKSQEGSIGPIVNFTDSELLAVAYQQDHVDSAYPASEVIVFDNAVFNQDIFISVDDAGSGTVPCNYYIELETMDLSEVETTMLTLKNLRTITSR
jgi:hypothetical protein|tara:strand:- start:34 stop:483 length:450 start_codon:yes stop_codon:yes gene_type:complete